MKQRALSEQEFESLYEACQNAKERFLVVVGGYQGLRINEVRRMRKAYLFRARDTWMIRIPAKEIDEGRHRIKSDERSIPVMHDRVREVWKEWFADHDGYDLPYVTCQKSIERLGKRAEIGHITCHTLRHTCGTWLSLNDWNAVEIAEFMGHRRIDTAMRHYIHPTGGMSRMAAKTKGRFDDLQNR